MQETDKHAIDGGVATELRAKMAQRILVLDGAWGTMLQGAQLTPADYRGGASSYWSR